MKCFYVWVNSGVTGFTYVVTDTDQKDWTSENILYQTDSVIELGYFLNNYHA